MCIVRSGIGSGRRILLITQFLKLPAYTLYSGAGILLASILFLTLPNSTNRMDRLAALAFSYLGLLVGGKLLYILLEFKTITTYLRTNPDTGKAIVDVLQGGFVYYGGMFGIIAGTCYSAKVNGNNTTSLLDSLFTVLPLAHALGRIGCYHAGCCHGSLMGLPIQLVECGCCLAIFSILLARSIIRHGQPNPYTGNFRLYLWMYSITRFFLEFFRDDSERHLWGALSTSQIISLLIIITLVVTCFTRKHLMVKQEPS